jgi:hypothetical protein
MARKPQDEVVSAPPAAGDDPGLKALLAARDKAYADAKAAQDAQETASGVTPAAPDTADDPGLDVLLAARDDAYRASAEHQAAQDLANANRRFYSTHQVPEPSDPVAFAKARASAAPSGDEPVDAVQEGRVKAKATRRRTKGGS